MEIWKKGILNIVGYWSATRLACLPYRIEEYQTEVANVHVHSLDHSSLSMLAFGFAGTGVISNCLAFNASVSHYWLNNGWTFCFPFCTYHAACENSAWTESKVKK